jgi:hypothetical protein
MHKIKLYILQAGGPLLAAKTREYTNLELLPGSAFDINWKLSSCLKNAWKFQDFFQFFLGRE